VRGVVAYPLIVTCCGSPILLVALLPLLRGLGGGISDSVGRYSFLLCPIRMIPMIFMMRPDRNSGLSVIGIDVDVNTPKTAGEKGREHIDRALKDRFIWEKSRK